MVRVQSRMRMKQHESRILGQGLNKDEDEATLINPSENSEEWVGINLKIS